MDKRNNSADNPHHTQCHDEHCVYQKPHLHVMTNNGHCVKYIIEKPRQRSMSDANTW